MSVIKRGNSKFWYVQFQFNGKTIVKSAKTTNKQKALLYEKKLREEVMSEELLGEKRLITVSDALDQYDLSQRSLASHGCIIANIKSIRKYLDCGKGVHQLTNADLDQLVACRRNDGKSEHTIKHTLNVVRGMWKLAKRRNYKVSDIDFPVISVPKNRTRYLSMEEEKRLIRELSPYREGTGLPPYEKRSDELKRNMWDAHDLVIILLDTGARLNEIQTLEWKDVDLTSKIIHLWRHKTKSETVLYMTNRIHEIIQRRKDNRNNSEYLFCARDNGPRKYARQSVAKAFKRAGLKDFRIHDLRHTTASRLIQNGLSLFEVAQILGHSSPATSARYAHLERSHVSAKAATVLDSLASQNKGATKVISLIQKYCTN